MSSLKFNAQLPRYHLLLNSCKPSQESLHWWSFLRSRMIFTLNWGLASLGIRDNWKMGDDILTQEKIFFVFYDSKVCDRPWAWKCPIQNRLSVIVVQSYPLREMLNSRPTILIREKQHRGQLLQARHGDTCISKKRHFPRHRENTHFTSFQYQRSSPRPCKLSTLSERRDNISPQVQALFSLCTIYIVANALN